jgi:hypothetical protein
VHVSTYEVPKPAGGRRLITVLAPVEDARYRAAVAAVAGLIERRLGPEAMANRARGHPELSLQPWEPAWRTFVRTCGEIAAGERGVMRLDVRECYPSIRPEVVEGVLRTLGARIEQIRRIRRALDRIGEGGVRGLPIGPDASAVLANGVLRTLDGALHEAGRPFVRWVDDAWVGVESRPHAQRVRDNVHRALRSVGLELNDDKTEVLDRADAQAWLGGPGGRASMGAGAASDEGEGACPRL